jgi:hypothetical protein
MTLLIFTLFLMTLLIMTLVIKITNNGFTYNYLIIRKVFISIVVVLREVSVSFSQGY